MMSHAETMSLDSSCYDLVRAIVSAFCWQDHKMLVPVSTLVVQYELRRRNQELPTKDMLRDLSDVRDVQRIDGGFWLPTPTHLVLSQDVGFVVSGLPTQELPAHYGLDINSLGTSRLIAGNSFDHIDAPRIQLSEWLFSPCSTRRWVEDLLKSAQYSEPYGMNSVEVFRNWKEQTTDRWVRFESAVIPSEQIVLARQRSRELRSNYYLLQVRGRKILAMHELSNTRDEIVRLMCGLRVIGDDPLICRVINERDKKFVRLAVGMLPRAEQCLLMALGQIVVFDQKRPIEAVVPNRTIATVLEIIEALGCKIEKGVR